MRRQGIASDIGLGLVSSYEPPVRDHHRGFMDLTHVYPVMAKALKKPSSRGVRTPPSSPAALRK